MATNIETNTQNVKLAPSYKIPWFLILGAIPLCLLNLWLGGVVAVFGLFLMVQAKIIRLQFSEKALEVYRSDKKIRSFPYSDWSNWQIFWQPVPILFYFREVNSIHFLPIIFDPQTLKACLKKYCPLQ